MAGVNHLLAQVQVQAQVVVVGVSHHSAAGQGCKWQVSVGIYKDGEVESLMR